MQCYIAPVNAVVAANLPAYDLTARSMNVSTATVLRIAMRVKPFGTCMDTKQAGPHHFRCRLGL